MFQEKEYRGLSPNFYIHVSVSELHKYSHVGSAFYKIATATHVASHNFYDT